MGEVRWGRWGRWGGGGRVGEAEGKGGIDYHLLAAKIITALDSMHSAHTLKKLFFIITHFHEEQKTLNEDFRGSGANLSCNVFNGFINIKIN